MPPLSKNFFSLDCANLSLVNLGFMFVRLRLVFVGVDTRLLFNHFLCTLEGLLILLVFSFKDESRCCIYFKIQNITRWRLPLKTLEGWIVISQTFTILDSDPLFYA